MSKYPFSQLIRNSCTSALGASVKLYRYTANVSNDAMATAVRTFGAPILAVAGVAPQGGMVYTPFVASWHQPNGRQLQLRKGGN